MNPVIEFYEYHIHDLNNNGKNIIYKFGDITDTESDKCGSIGVEGSLKNPIDSISSCDPIESINNDKTIDYLSGGNQHHRYLSFYDIDNLYQNYKNFFVKYSTEEILNNNSIKSIFDNIDGAYLNQKNLLQENLLQENLLQENLSEYIKENEEENIDKLIQINLNSSILLKINLNETDKIILIGDIHGSFHTFFRILCRLHRYDILNLENFQLTKGYKIIFLGDILDRGEYSLDVINIIFKLILTNNTTEFNIIYNRGNHETFDIFYRDGSNTEFQKKFAQFTNYDLFIKKYIRLLNILPSAIILSIGNKNIWCCHGGFPRQYLYTNIDFKEKNIILFRDNDITMDIKWSDFGSNDSSDFTLSSRGGNLLNYTYYGTEKFLNTNNINFIIRGHQDSIGNSVLFNKNGDNYIISKKQNEIKGLIYNKINDIYRTDGAIARLLPLELSEDYFRVLTISTNSDKGRYLNSDSFILLRFDINNNINEFKNCLKPLEIKKIVELLNNPSLINKSDLLQKKLKLIDEIVDIHTELLQKNIYTIELEKKFIVINLIFEYLYNKFEKISNKLEELMSNYESYELAKTNRVLSEYYLNVIDEKQHKSIKKYINTNKIIIKNLLKKIDDNIAIFLELKTKKNELDEDKIKFLNDKMQILDKKIELIYE
jgi:hypothetical protein